MRWRAWRIGLPPGLDPPVVQKQDTDSSPIMTLAVSGPRQASELFLLADRYVKNVIESAPGVGQVTIAGAADRAVQVNIDAAPAGGASSCRSCRCATRWRSRTRRCRAGGSMTGLRELTLRTRGADGGGRAIFRDLTVATMGGAAVRLEDLGEVRDATKEVRTLARLNGEPAVVLQVQRQSGENTVEVIEEIKKRLAAVRGAVAGRH